MKTSKFNKTVLKGVKSNRSPFNRYGKIIKLNAFVTLVALDFVIPSFRLITVIAYKFKNKLENVEITRFTVHNKEI